MVIGKRVVSPLILALVLFISFLSCTENKEKMLERQYYVNGRMLYLENCANCHGKKGNGIGQLYPPLANADYLKNNIEDLSCIIKYGLSKPIKVNGVDYQLAMPANNDLENLDIAQIVHYVRTEFAGKKNFISQTEIIKRLNNCDDWDEPATSNVK